MNRNLIIALALASMAVPVPAGDSVAVYSLRNCCEVPVTARFAIRLDGSPYYPEGWHTLSPDEEYVFSSNQPLLWFQVRTSSLGDVVVPLSKIPCLRGHSEINQNWNFDLQNAQITDSLIVTAEKWKNGWFNGGCPPEPN